MLPATNSTKPPDLAIAPELAMQKIHALEDQCRRLIPVCKTLAALNDPLAGPLQELLRLWASQTERELRTSAPTAGSIARLNKGLDAFQQIEDRLKEKTGRAYVRQGWQSWQEGLTVQACQAFERAKLEDPRLSEAALALVLVRTSP